MTSSKLAHCVITAVVATCCTGCMSDMICLQKFKSLKPVRAPQLDRLDALLGEWSTEGEVRIATMDQVLRTTGTNSARWTLDRRFLVEDAELDMGELGRVTGTSIWSWDPRLKKYRMWWFDSLGETSESIVTYREKTKTWHMKSRGQKYGYGTRGTGTLKHIDDDTLEWTWREWDSTGLFKFADMKGVSRRKR